jgi:maleate isomerase
MRASETRWRRDGWDARVRLGVLVPHAAVGPEAELQAMAPRGVSIHGTRVPFGAMLPGGRMDPTIPLAPVRAFAEPPYVDEAAELLAASPLHAIAFANTGACYAIGVEGEVAMIDRLARRTRGIPVLSTCRASVDGLHAFGVTRIAIVNPPWFDAELDALGRRYYESAGFDVVYSAPCGLPSDQMKITPADLHAWVTEHVPDDADAVVIGGNGLRAVGAIAAIEADLDRPVLTANQVLLWSALRVASADPGPVTDYGRLFRHR